MITERIRYPWRRPDSDTRETIHVPDSTVSLKACKPVSFQALLGNAPVQEHFPLADEVYRKYFTTPLSVYSVDREGDVNNTLEYVIVGPKMTAYDVNAMLYFAAPDKSNGFATEDILRTWDTSTADVYPLAIESYIPADFDPLTTEGDRIVNILTRNVSPVGYADQDMHDTLAPVLRIYRDGDSIAINLDPFDDDLLKTVFEASKEKMRDKDQASIGLGVLYVAAYSPENTHWPDDVTPATVLPHVYTAIEKAQQGDVVSPKSDIQKSPLLTALATQIIDLTPLPYTAQSF